MVNLKLLSAVYLGWGLGANDAANTFGPGVAAKAVSYKTAVILISIFVVIGALAEGPKTFDVFSGFGNINLTDAFLAAMAAAITINILTVKGIPSSVSQAMIGGIFGITLTADPKNLTKIVLSWIGTPIGAAIISVILFYILKNILVKTVKKDSTLNAIAKLGLILSGIAGAYALGANNVANVTGVFYEAGALSAVQASILGGLSIAFGAVTYSKKVMLSVGEKITILGPFEALIATLSSAVTVWIYTQIGVPVSTSQAIVGAVFGVGLIRGIQAVNKRNIIIIVIGWFATPTSAFIIAFLIKRIYFFIF